MSTWEIFSSREHGTGAVLHQQADRFVGIRYNSQIHFGTRDGFLVEGTHKLKPIVPPSGRTE